MNVAERRNDRLAEALERAEQAYVARTPASREWHERARQHLPGGNTRTVLHFSPYPLRVVEGRGQYLTDADGHVYADFLGEYSAGLYGHSAPVIVAAAKEAIDGGTVLGAPNRYEVELAELISSRFPSCELVRFTNSGTEANLMALGAARAHTGRDHVLVFRGAYHGGVLYFSDYAKPVNVPFNYLIGTYNDLDATLAAARGHEKEIAAILVEPMMGGGGGIPAERAFLQGLRDFASQNGIVLIFDEVMTSRTGPSGLQGELKIVPDMTTLGKYLGGGFSFGAFGGRAEIMQRFDPSQPGGVPHAGTFNNNVISMASGVAGLRHLYPPEVAVRHTARGEAFRARLNCIVGRLGLSAQVTGVGTLMCVHFHDRPVRSPADTEATRPEARALFHLEMLARGFYFARRGYMSLSLALDDEDCASYARAFEEVLGEYGEVLCRV